MKGQIIKNSPDPENAAPQRAHETLKQPAITKQGLLIDALANLPDKAIMDEARLARALRVTGRTVRRMVSRYELPPPIQLAGRSCWIAGRILRYIENAAERAERKAERDARRLRSMTP